MNLSRIAIALLAATAAFSADSVIDARAGLNDQVIRAEINGVFDLAPQKSDSLKIVGGYRSLESMGDSAEEYTIGAGVRADLSRHTVLTFGVGLRLRDGEDTTETMQDVTTTTTTTNTVVIVTPGKVHTPHGNGHHYGWAHQGPTSTTVTTTTSTTTESTEHILGSESEDLDNSPLLYATLNHRIWLSRDVDLNLDLVGNAVWMLDGLEANIGALIGYGNVSVGCIDQIREYHGAGNLLDRVESEDRGLALVGRIALGNITIGANYLLEQETLMATASLKF